jgi:hypothetical protein
MGDRAGAAAHLESPGPTSTRKAVICLRGPRGVSLTPVTVKRMTKSGVVTQLMKCLLPLMT